MTALGGVNGTVCDAQQYQQFLQSYDSPSPSISCLTHGETIGLAFAVEAAVISCICVIIILFWIGRNVHWYKKTFPNGNWKLFRGPCDVYMLSLFVFDLLQAIGGMMYARWAHDGIVTTGPYCTVQGVIGQIGELGVALITLFLAVHTFVDAVLPAQTVRIDLKARGVALSFSLVSVACIYITLWVAIGAGIHKNYDTPTPYWCWVSPQFPGERLGGEYVWLWIALFASVILYIPLHFWAEGFWSIDEKYKFHWWKADQRDEHAQTRTALGTLLYPLTNSIVVLPLSIARWLQFSHHHVPSAAAFFGTSIFHLSGAINVLLFLNIRPGLLLFPRPGQLESLEEQEIQPTPQEDTGAAIIFVDTTNFQRSPRPTPAALGDEGSRGSATPSHVNSRRISEDFDI